MERLWPPDGDGVTDDQAGPSTPGGPRGGIDAADVHAELARRPSWVASNFVAALDGAISVDGRSGPLGGDGDLAVFRSLRDHADAILVGAGTVRAENYGPSRARAVPRRRARGQADRARLVVVTRSADLLDLPRLWSEPGAPLTVLTGTDAPAERVAALRDRAEVLAVGDHGPDLAAGLALLADRGEGRILVEGGPALHADLLDAGLLTDLFTTVAPTVVGGGATTVDRPLGTRVPLTLAAVWRHDDELFLHHHVPHP